MKINRHLWSIICCWLTVQQVFVAVVVLAKSSHSLATSTTTTIAPEPTASVAKEQQQQQEQNEDEDEEPEAKTTSGAGVVTENESTVGASRVGYGIPSDPHPSIKAIYKNPEYLRKTGYTADAILVTNRPDPQEHFFVGHGVLLDKSHVLTDHESWENTHVLDDPSFSTIHGLAPLKEIDVAAPNEFLHRPQAKTWLNPVNKRIGGSGLSLFQLTDEHEIPKAYHKRVAPAKLETNVKEFGSDCFLHGYGQDSGMGSSRGSKIEPFYNTTKRQYVKIPLDMSLSRCPEGGQTCQLTAKKDHAVCETSASGAPVLCGKEEKLTYMAKPRFDSDCYRQFDAYHIPRLVDHIQPYLNNS